MNKTNRSFRTQSKDEVSRRYTRAAKKCASLERKLGDLNETLFLLGSLGESDRKIRAVQKEIAKLERAISEASAEEKLATRNMLYTFDRIGER